MGSEVSKGETKAVVQAAAVIANSKAAEKLAGAVEGLVQLPHKALDYIVGARRITSINEAHAAGKLLTARTDAEIERLRAETAEFVLDREMRKTLNRQSILAEAQKALPPPDQPVSDEPVSKDFIHAFFDEFDGISDPEVQRIAGRLLANEVIRPGSFPRRTLRVLKDLESREFKLFAALCRYCWHVTGTVPLVFGPNDPIYIQNGLNFGTFAELQSLGLVTFGTVAGFRREGLPPKFKVSYGNITVEIELPEGQSAISLGAVVFTEAGIRLAPLTQATLVPEFVDYVLQQWRAEGIKAEVLSTATAA